MPFIPKLKGVETLGLSELNGGVTNNNEVVVAAETTVIVEVPAT